MTVFIENETTDFEFDFQKIINDCVESTLDYVDFPYEAQINVLITDESTIKDINNEQRGIDSPTDVLSFPMLDFNEPLDFSGIDEEVIAYDMDSEEIVLGDIVLCREKIFAQAQLYGHEPIREMGFLVVHSMLHLLGFDHNHDNQEINELTQMTMEMEKLQEEILTKLNITR